MPAEVALSRLDPTYLDLEWPRISAALRSPRAAPSPLPLEQLRNAVMAGLRDLWTAPDVLYPSRLGGVVLTTIVTTPRGKLLRAHYLNGKRAQAWINPGAEALGRFASQHGCSRLQLVGWRWRMRGGYRQRFGLPVSWAAEGE